MPDTMRATTPFHPGELAVQRRAGEDAAASLNGRMLGTRVPAAALRFVAQQPLCAVATRDADGALWAACLSGPPGFATASEDGAQLRLALHDAAGVLPLLRPFRAVMPGHPLGLLFIDLATRRRLRVNGRLAFLDDGAWTLTVEEAFPNCPKYIHRRTLQASAHEHHGAVQDGKAFTPALQAWIDAADTFFVASGHPTGLLDANHRGGAPGFVRRTAAGALRIPDYPGNSMFNTLGNLALDPACGLCFPDFANARQLMLSGHARLSFDVAEDRAATGGTGRWWTFEPRRWQVAPLNHRLDFCYVDASPFNP